MYGRASYSYCIRFYLVRYGIKLGCKSKNSIVLVKYCMIQILRPAAVGAPRPNTIMSAPVPPPPRAMLLGATLVAGVYLISPSRALRSIHTVVPQHTLADQRPVCSWDGCPPPPPPTVDDTQPHTHALSHPPPFPASDPGCDADGECTVAALVRRHAVDNTVIVTFGNARQAIFTENWVYHLRRLGVGGLLVGMMNMHSAQPQYTRFAVKLRALGVGVYTVNSPQVAKQPQGGRWFHVIPLLQTGARVLLSDSDVVWLRCEDAPGTLEAQACTLAPLPLPVKESALARCERPPCS